MKGNLLHLIMPLIHYYTSDNLYFMAFFTLFQMRRHQSHGPTVLLTRPV